MTNIASRILAKGPLRLGAKVLQSLAQNGLRPTLAKVSRFMASGPPAGLGPRAKPNEIYKYTRDSQDRYVRAYAQLPSKTRRRVLEEMLHAEAGHRGVVIYPATHTLKLRQRPEHVLQSLADDGYLCLILKIGGNQATLHQRGVRLYESNLYEDVLAYFRDAPVTVYVTAPMHRYVAELMPQAFVIYDVLDKTEIFANYCTAMVADHEAMLKRADLVLCSSSALYADVVKRCRHACLIPNGVFPADFTPSVAPPDPPPLVIGYHGAISELLDFDLLDSLAALPGVELVLAGPVAAFAAARRDGLVTRTEALFARANVTHLGVLGYDEIKDYMGRIHCGLIPFLVTSATDVVSPLKFFEFVAAGKPVLATPTRTMTEYADVVLVGDAAALVTAVTGGHWNKRDPSRCVELIRRHTWTELTVPVKSALDAREYRLPATPKAPAATRVDIVNFNFFDWHGESVYKGGAERYVCDVARLCKGMGLPVRILQNAHAPFERNFLGIDVVGVPIVDKMDLRRMSRGYVPITADSGLIVASPLDLASELDPGKRVIGINHGIHWDGRANRAFNFDPAAHRPILEALRVADACVCVDTNFINWVRTIDWALAQHLDYIPNYVDGDQFSPALKDFAAPRVVALYPRRLYEARGLNETLEAFDFLLPRHANLDLHLCGQASPEDAERTRHFVARHPGRVSWYELDMDDMSQAYARSHIALIPTAYSEGTSLSCIEAMATRNAVIATNVGGLPNLIIDGFNGLLIRPDTWDLVRAVERLLEDRELATTLAQNALDVSRAFGKARWAQQWEALIRSVMQLPDQRQRPGEPAQSPNMPG